MNYGEQAVTPGTERPDRADFSKLSGGDGPGHGLRRQPPKGQGFTLRDPRGGQQDGWVESGTGPAAGLSGVWAHWPLQEPGQRRAGAQGLMEALAGRAGEPGGEV